MWSVVVAGGQQSQPVTGMAPGTPTKPATSRATRGTTEPMTTGQSLQVTLSHSRIQLSLLIRNLLIRNPLIRNFQLYGTELISRLGNS